MVESLLHKCLVDVIKKWILVSCSEEMIIYSDTENNIFTKNIPPKIDFCIPDLFAIGKKSRRIIIGEAKTSLCDLESEHSERQIVTYLKYCSNKNNSIVILSVPLYLINCAKSLISSLKMKNYIGNVQTYIINPFLL